MGAAGSAQDRARQPAHGSMRRSGASGPKRRLGHPTRRNNEAQAVRNAQTEHSDGNSSSRRHNTASRDGARPGSPATSVTQPFGMRTLLMTWMTPFEAPTSAVVT